MSEEEDTDWGTDEARLATSSSSPEAKGNALKRFIVRGEKHMEQKPTALEADHLGAPVANSATLE